MFNTLHRLVENFIKFPDRNAFFIRGRYHTYAAFESRIAAICQQIIEQADHDEEYLGILTYDDIETYASVYAIWCLGRAYVPLNPTNPLKRNMEIIRQVGIRSLLSSGTAAVDSMFADAGARIIDTSAADRKEDAPPAKRVEPLDDVDKDADCYVLFTSGSTGKPKGVPISRFNLDSYMQSFFGAGYELDENDRFLQIYDLSFDASVRCYSIPLAVGGCIYTVPRDQIKYLYAYKLMKEHQLTFVAMPPSTLSYLQPYFNSIYLEHLRYCLLGGESFSSIMAERWAPCIPNAQIQNIYGPTEFTINSHIYNWQSALNKEKSSNGIVSIGKCIGDTIAMVVDSNLTQLRENEKGELCLSGSQQTRGYWKDEEQTGKVFFEREIEGEKHRFYRTGDLVYRDSDGDYMYIGRLDSQVQIQGYRVELSEIEKHVTEFLEGANVVVIPIISENQITTLVLFLENVNRSVDEVNEYLERSMPAYMVPRKIIKLSTFPKSAGGKINRNALKIQIPKE